MELDLVDAYWRAANYLSVGQIYLRDNPLLREPLRPEHVKKRLLGHWGTTPGLNFIYAHLNRLIHQHKLNMLFVTGPGHGGPGIVANTYLEGTYSQLYPEVSLDEPGMRRLFKQFSFPGGIPSHVAAEIPGSIHEGGELGYSLAHAFGAAFDNPDLIVACVIGDGEAETGPLACSWHSNKFLNPHHDGVVLPILHLNGYKIANPTLLARIPHEELVGLLRGYGYHPHFVEGHDPPEMHARMATCLEKCLEEIQQCRRARTRPPWPLLVLRTPKGWTGPRQVDGEKTEGSWRSHQVPFKDARGRHLGLLEEWLHSYRAHELFDENGSPRLYLRALVPEHPMSANPHANGGSLLRPLELPALEPYALTVEQPARRAGQATAVLGGWLRDVLAANRSQRNFRVFGPDETASNRLQDVFVESGRTWWAERLPEDDEGGHLSDDGRVMEVLSEHLCQGWLEGYLLTGRHGVFSCYEAFIHIVDSMFNQHAKWLKSAGDLPWRHPIASLNYLLTSHVWRQDHNGFSHQDPGFIDHVVNKKADVVRVYLPPDANTLLCTMEHCLRSRNYVNVVVAGKQRAWQYLDLPAARAHCRAGLGRWAWASSDHDGETEAVLACAGDVPTMEALAAAELLLERFSDLRLRFVNVVDLMTLQPPSLHPHGLADADFDNLFTRDKPVIFAYHGYPWLIHRLTYRRANHAGLHVHGYQEEGTTTTPFDMVVRNRLDRFSLARQVAQYVPRLRSQLPGFETWVEQQLQDHHRYIREHGEDLPAIRDWRWSGRVAQYR